MSYTHYCGPRKGIINVETDVPALPIKLREKQAKTKPAKPKSKKQQLQDAKDKAVIEGWRQDKRMVFLSNPGRDLTAKERAEWERSIRQYQVTYYPE